MNNVIIIEGNCGRDAEHKSTKSGGDMVTTSVAVYRSKEKSDWFNLKAFDSVAKKLMEAKKGDKLEVVGRCEIDEWEKDGVKKQAVSVVVSAVRILPKKEKPVDQTTPF